MSVAGKAFDFILLKKMIGYAKDHRHLIWVAGGLTFLSALLSPIRPYLVQYTFDHYITQNDLPGLGKMSIIIIVALILETAVQYGAGFISNFWVRIFKECITLGLSASGFLDEIESFELSKRAEEFSDLFFV